LFSHSLTNEIDEFGCKILKRSRKKKVIKERKKSKRSESRRNLRDYESLKLTFFYKNTLK